jgi:glycosyltransferase involved in cell wall biosynthesis
MFHGGLLAERISRLYRVPFVITEHSSVFARGLVHKWQIRSGARVVKKASETLAVSEALARLLGECYGSPTSQWKYLPNIVADQFASAPLGLNKATPDGKFTFCSIAYLSRQKGIDLLLRAFAKAFKSDPQMRLVIGGDGEERASLEQQARDLGIAPHVDFLGHLGREQVLNVMSGSDAIVLSSHYETFGVILVEALALGKPVLATRCGGPESIVQPGDGLLVEAGNVEAMAEGMHQLRKDASNYDARLIRQSCLERFSEAAVVEQLSGIYEDAVGNRSNEDG